MKDSFLSISSDDLDVSFRKKQIYQAVFNNAILNFNDITTIPTALRLKLDESFFILNLIETKRQSSKDGTVKFLLKLFDGEFIESVFLIDKNNNVTFCISTQVGCRMSCVFCKTGSMGLRRNLDASEIVQQILYLYNYMIYEKKITNQLFNIVFMGMGEPLDNLAQLELATTYLTDKEYFGLSPSRITVSTSGLLDELTSFLTIHPQVHIAVSLNSAIQEDRLKIMPIANKYSIDDLQRELLKLAKKYKKRITLEYVLIDNKNNRQEDLEALKKFKHSSFHLNIIPLNHSDSDNQRPSEKKIKEFLNSLNKMGFNATRRYRRGEDIQADCGQLFVDALQS